MLNNCYLMGTVNDIFENSFIIEFKDSNAEPHQVKIYGVQDEEIAILLLNNVVGVRCSVVENDENSVRLVLDKLTILDSRGSKK